MSIRAIFVIIFHFAFSSWLNRNLATYAVFILPGVGVLCRVNSLFGLLCSYIYSHITVHTEVHYLFVAEILLSIVGISNGYYFFEMKNLAFVFQTIVIILEFCFDSSIVRSRRTSSSGLLLIKLQRGSILSIIYFFSFKFFQIMEFFISVLLGIFLIVIYNEQYYVLDNLVCEEFSLKIILFYFN
uniref:Acyl_transf_3 domain-containing protein n=1 Tax=Heterorhabditis bacteriophora TaxID=37862 RepID=A0A1I7WBQ1_HETBA